MTASRAGGDATERNGIETAAADEPGSTEEHVGPPETVGVGQTEGWIDNGDGPNPACDSTLPNGAADELGLAAVAAIHALADALLEAATAGDHQRVHAAALAIAGIVGGLDPFSTSFSNE